MGAEYPYPPRMMTRRRAAHYCDLPLAEFDRMVASGDLPPPVPGFGNQDHWSRVAIDEHLEGVTGDSSWMAAQPFFRDVA